MVESESEKNSVPGDASAFHEPVLLKEVLSALGLERNVAKPERPLYVDCTLGMGGHAEAILKACAPEGRLLGLDRDEAALEIAEKRLRTEAGRFSLKKADFRQIAERVAQFRADHGPMDMMGILFDLGLSSYQIERSGRGFSFQRSEPLDMRMDPDLSLSAADLVNGLSESALKALIHQNSDERWAGRIASRIARIRKEEGAILRTEQLEAIVWRATPKQHRHGRIHPATRTFQALRIAVNDEIAQIEAGLRSAISLLDPGGRVVVISFHSLEDRCVKHLFKHFAQSGAEASGKRFVRLFKKPLQADSEEVLRNRRSRSAKLRALERAA